MEKKTIVQRLKKTSKDIYECAQRYYSIIGAINGFHMTERELQLVAFTAIRGMISYLNVKEEFCEMYNSTPATVNNMVVKLKKMGIFVKDGNKTRVNPAICLDFTKDVQLEIKLLTDGQAS
jgi:ribosomal protein L23